MTDNPQIVGALIALSGLFLGALSSWGLAFINRRYDDRRHLRQLAIETAVVYWKQDFEFAKLRGELTRQTQVITPLDIYIVHMLQIAELISSTRLTKDNVAAELMRIREITHEARRAAAKKHPSE